MQETIEVLGTFIREALPTPDTWHITIRYSTPWGRDKGLNPHKNQCIQSITFQSKSWL